MFTVCDEKNMVEILVEAEAFEGVKRIAGKLQQDFKLVFGRMPKLVTAENVKAEQVILVATLGHSPLMEQLQERENLPAARIAGRRECYFWKFVPNPLPGVKQALLICGSDKRGTIYGMFHLSELMGVSPWYDWADVPVKRLGGLKLGKDSECVSKEPSVRYRGFFINDEWPAYGNWTCEHFGGFTAEMYDKVFELLLRLKGNYLWPAMWSSSFPLDGPGLASAELADIYGVVMGTSHHEPCLRASEEWDLCKGADSIYGTEWNYATNREGLLNYWRDGLKRSGHLESVITIGMRGERDTSMLGPDATLEENISLLKDIIENQRRLIRENVPEADRVPLMMALYKEVEAYYYGDEQTPGLKDWDGLDGVTLMLCEDNYGNMRTLPTKEMQKHAGGFGMYYHFDYHGGPISYEWVNSTRLSKVWEQMTMAYEYGVRDIWIVNVGDLKPQELPLSYFMDLAYDYEKWGIRAVNTTHNYIRTWVKNLFGSVLSDMELGQILVLLEGYTRMNSNRRPEALSSTTYHPVHFGEAATVFQEAGGLYECSERMLEWMPEEVADAYWELVHFPVCASANVIRMQIAAGWNRYCAELEDRDRANLWAAYVAVCVERDRMLTDAYHRCAGGKWNGMALSKHVGFVNWNDEGSGYPICRVCAEDGWREIGAEDLLQEPWQEQVAALGDPKDIFTCDAQLMDAIPAPDAADYPYIALEANQYTDRVAVGKAGWECLTDYGRNDVAMKVFPVTRSFRKAGPELVYEFTAEQGGAYTLELYAAPTNALTMGGSQCVGVTLGKEAMQKVSFLQEDFKAGDCFNWSWCQGVLDNVHRATLNVRLKKGKNRVVITALDAGVVLERLVFWKDYADRPRSYFGPSAILPCN